MEGQNNSNSDSRNSSSENSFNAESNLFVHPDNSSTPAVNLSLSSLHDPTPNSGFMELMENQHFPDEGRIAIHLPNENNCLENNGLTLTTSSNSTMSSDNANEGHRIVADLELGVLETDPGSSSGPSESRGQGLLLLDHIRNLAPSFSSFLQDVISPVYMGQTAYVDYQLVILFMELYVHYLQIAIHHPEMMDLFDDDEDEDEEENNEDGNDDDEDEDEEENNEDGNDDEDEDEEENNGDGNDDEDTITDIDEMSYEELLALGEHIGNVSTGLSEENIAQCVERFKYQPSEATSEEREDICCICWGDYVETEDLGKLNCGHQLHFECIKLWLMRKNSCPVCKRDAKSD